MVKTDIYEEGGVLSSIATTMSVVRTRTRLVSKALPVLRLQLLDQVS